MDEKKKTKFIEPDAEVVIFDDSDIITLSANATGGWGTDGYREGWF